MSEIIRVSWQMMRWKVLDLRRTYLYAVNLTYVALIYLHYTETYHLISITPRFCFRSYSNLFRILWQRKRNFLPSLSNYTWDMQVSTLGCLLLFLWRYHGILVVTLVFEQSIFLCKDLLNHSRKFYRAGFFCKTF